MHLTAASAMTADMGAKPAEERLLRGSGLEEWPGYGYMREKVGRW